MNTKVLIIGYYGSGNLGDEVLLDAAIKMLNTAYESPKITVLTNDIEDTRKTRNVEVVYSRDYLQIIKTIKNSDMVIGGGGSMLQNATSNKSLIYYLAILKIGKLLGKKVALLGNGIGPLNGKFYQRLSINILKKLDAIVLRDHDSYNLLKKFKLRNIHLANDLVYTLDGIERSSKIEKKILLNLRKWDYDPSFIDTIEEFIKYLIQENFKVTLISFQSSNDELILKDIYNKINSKKLNYFESREYEKIILEISSAEIFIGMRLHGLIFSSICKTPFIGLAYDPKVSSLCENLNQEYFKDLNKITFNGIIDTFDNVYKNRNYYENKLIKNTDEIKKLNGVHSKVLEMLKNK